MLWNVIKKDDCILYLNNDIELKVKVCEMGDKANIYMNYKGFNLTIPMLVWEFGEDLSIASIDSVNVGGNTSSEQYFIVNKRDIEKFINEIYFFLVDNNMDSMCQEKYFIKGE